MMITAIFFFSLMDATVKGLSQDLHTAQVLWARYTGQLIALLPFVLPRLTRTLKTRHLHIQVARAFLMMGATFCFFTSLRHIGLAEATAVMDLNPMLTTLGAALFLGERFGPRRALGVGAAVVGALIIIRPGMAVFSPYALLPLLAACCYTSFSLLTRWVGASESPLTSMLYTALIGASVLSVIVLPYWITPAPKHWALMALIGGLGATGQMLMIRSLSLGEASLVAPFTYVGLPLATLWAVVFFGDWPDAATILGALVIVGAGLYVWHREARQNLPSTCARLPLDAATPTQPPESPRDDR
ncbi:DMT family transporter [Aquimixticola soesokkakensis]|nr:DMT family transporter [Aquimixticola soesokkakensis]